MKILKKLKTMITARGLTVLLLGKEVFMPDGTNLGRIAAIKTELPHDKIWIVVDNLGQEMMISLEQITSVANKVVLFEDLPVSLVVNK